MELLGLVLSPAINTARRHIRSLANIESPGSSDGFRVAMQFVALKCLCQNDHIQDAVEKIQQKEFLASKSWIEQAITALGQNNHERVKLCMQRAEEEAQKAKHALNCKTTEQCRQLLDCYSIIMTAGYYVASNGGLDTQSGIACIDAYYTELKSDLRVKRILSKVAKSGVYLSGEEERLLMAAARFDWEINSKPALKWVTETAKDGWKAGLIPAASTLLGCTEISGPSRHILRRSVLQMAPLQIDLPPYLTDITFCPGTTEGSVITVYEDSVILYDVTSELQMIEYHTLRQQVVSASTNKSGIIAILNSDYDVDIYYRKEDNNGNSSEKSSKKLQLKKSIDTNGTTFCMAWAGTLLCISDGSLVYVYNEYAQLLYKITAATDTNSVYDIAGTGTGLVCIILKEDDLTDTVCCKSWDVYAKGTNLESFYISHSFENSQSSSESNEECDFSSSMAVVDYHAWVLLPPSRNVHLVSKFGGVLHTPSECTQICGSGSLLCTADVDGMILVWETFSTHNGLESYLLHALDTSWSVIHRITGSSSEDWQQPLIFAYGAATSSSVAMISGLDEDSLLSKMLFWKLSAGGGVLQDRDRPRSPRTAKSPTETASPVFKKTSLRERATSLFPKKGKPSDVPLSSNTLEVGTSQDRPRSPSIVNSPTEASPAIRKASLRERASSLFPKKGKPVDVPPSSSNVDIVT